MITRVQGTLSGTVVVPPSKSVAHRMLICAALSDSPCTVRCSQTNRDMDATAACLNALGAQITYSDGAYHVTPVATPTKGGTLDCGESGSTLRFLLPVAAALGADAIFIGQGRLPERPLSPLYEEMTAHGIQMSANGHMPLTCQGKLPAGTYTLDAGVSSQFISGLLMALPLSGQDCSIVLTGHIESAPYIELTLNALSRFGIEVERTGNGFFIPGGQKYHSQPEMTVEGDWSGAAFWMVAGAAGKGSITCAGMDYEGSSQGDRTVVDVLRRMGAEITTAAEGITAHPSSLKGCTIDCADIPDLVPVLSVAAAHASGTTVFENVRRLRIKESDRIQSILDMLCPMGISASATENTLTVTGGTASDGTYNPSQDHRMAMSAAVLAATQGTSVTILDSECTAKSYPAFFQDFSSLGGLTEEKQ